MKKEQTYILGMIIGAVAAFMVTVMSYVIITTVSEGVSVLNWFIVTISGGVLIGALIVYVIESAMPTTMKKQFRKR